MQKTFCKTVLSLIMLAVLLPGMLSAQSDAELSDLPDQPDASFSNLARRPRFETIEEILIRNDEILLLARGNEAREYELEKVYYVYRELSSYAGTDGQTQRYSGLVDIVYLKSREETTLYFQPVWMGGSVNFQPGMLLVEGNFPFRNISTADTSGSPGVSMGETRGDTRIHLGASSNFSSVELFSGFSSRGTDSLKDLGFSFYVDLGASAPGTSSPVQASATINLDWYMINLPVFQLKGAAGLRTEIQPGEGSEMFVSGGTAAILKLNDINPAIPLGIELMPYTHGTSGGWMFKLAVTAFLSL